MSVHPLKFHDTLRGRKETFSPLEPGRVKMYVCGITPYDESHLGHARCYVFFDTVRRFLRHLGYRVTYVQNFTDIDDKIIARASQDGADPAAVAQRNIDDYFAKTALLNVERADAYPRVTQALPEIVQFIGKLLERSLAYRLEGGVYYGVRNFPGYGKLSKRSLEELESGARVAVDEAKRDPLDFALWKSAKPGEPSWDSPWGPGRPGWHIECSVMSIRHLGETFDIHGGGQDLIFPHHENEIAQSEGLTGKPFARYWLHNGFVTVNREKMSKSLGNFFTLSEIFAKVPPPVVRFFLLSRHYRSPLDFSDDLLNQARNAYDHLTSVLESAAFLRGAKPPEGPLLDEWVRPFEEALADDFNTEKAIGTAFQLRNALAEKLQARQAEWVARAQRTLQFFLTDLLGVPFRSALTPELCRSFRAQLEKREAARKAKDWKEADAVRESVESAGFSIEDTPQGPLLKPRAHG